MSEDSSIDDTLQLAQLSVNYGEYTGPVPKTLQKGILKTILWILPIIAAAIFAVIAAAGGYLSNPYPVGTDDHNTRITAMLNYPYYVAIFVIAWYAILITRAKTFDAMKESYKIMKIEPAEHEKLYQLFFGNKNIISIIIIGVILGIYEFCAFASGPYVRSIYDSTAVEGWYWDVYSADGSGVAYYSTGAIPIAWLIMWLLCDFFSACFCVYAIAFLRYSTKMIKGYSYRNDIEIVNQMHLTGAEEKAFIAGSLGYIPFLVIKSIAQIFTAYFAPWWHDQIMLFLILGFFVLCLIMPPQLIARDIKKDALQAEARAKAKSVLQIVEIIKKIENGEKVTLKGVLPSLLYNAYLEQAKASKQQGTQNNKKIATAVAGPVASYGAKIALGGAKL